MSYGWKQDLVVLETRPGSWRDEVDALLYNPRNTSTPYIVARGFDAASASWASGNYLDDLMDALVELRGCVHPDHAISGCSRDDVMELYGRDWGIGFDEAASIASEVNSEIGEDDALYSEALYSAVVRHCGCSSDFSRACAAASDKLSAAADACDEGEPRELALVASELALLCRTDSAARERIYSLHCDGATLEDAIANYALLSAAERLGTSRARDARDPSSRAEHATRAALRGSEADAPSRGTGSIRR